MDPEQIMICKISCVKIYNEINNPVYAGLDLISEINAKARTDIDPVEFFKYLRNVVRGFHPQSIKQHNNISPENMTLYNDFFKVVFQDIRVIEQINAGDYENNLCINRLHYYIKNGRFPDEPAKIHAHKLTALSDNLHFRQPLRVPEMIERTSMRVPEMMKGNRNV